jgi:7-cyano-7-deazaguanine synthase
MDKIVVSISGGMDSATLLGYAHHLFDRVHPVAFTYGSKHNPYEIESARQVAAFYGHENLDVVDLTGVFEHMQSNLLTSGGEIPEGHYEAETMSQTVVPGRNTIFISILLGIAQSVGAIGVGVGIHSGDHAIYPDCRPEYAGAMARVLKEASEDTVSLWAPFMHYDKHRILELGHRLDPEVPYNLTRTCYKAQPVSCGKCGSCQERLEAWQKLGRVDPIEYESRTILPFSQHRIQFKEES